jgi:hypothetical protein
LLSRKPALGPGLGVAPRARHFHHDPELRRRAELTVSRAQVAAPRQREAQPSPFNKDQVRLGQFKPSQPKPRKVDQDPFDPDRFDQGRFDNVHFRQAEPGHARSQARSRPVARPGRLRSALQENLLLISSGLLLVGALGWTLLVYDEFRQSGLFAPAPAPILAMAVGHDGGIGKSDSVGGISSYPRTDAVRSVVASRFASAGDVTSSLGAPGSGEAAASVIARDWTFFQPGEGQQSAPATKTAKLKTPAAPIRVASVGPTPPLATLNPTPDLGASRLPANIAAKTTLVDFQTAPFPYHGAVPGTDHPFLHSGEHVNFRGRVFLESKTFGDDHVLLHIPAGFDAKRPAVMVVFFHGHGATLARDVRDRQRLPEQMDGGTNAVLVAPQFAYDAADSSAGKFWEADGFKRFLDEAAQKLAALYGDARSQAAFANMPIVLVSYSGGFGPTLSVLARGGANSRIRGLVMLDSIYAGVDQFADWIADHRSTFFVSSYTAGTARHNAELKRLLSDRSIPYTSELRRGRLGGMVTFMDEEVPHRDYVTHAWTDNPVEDILTRMDDIKTDVQTAGIAAAARH